MICHLYGNKCLNISSSTTTGTSVKGFCLDFDRRLDTHESSNPAQD